MSQIFKSINNIMQEVESISKQRKNVQQGYMFRGIDDLYNSLHGLFKKHGVFITSNVLESKREERATQKGGVLIYTILKCQFSFFAQDGSNVSSTMEGEAMDSGDKSTNKAMSTALKYALMQMFLIPTEDEKDTEYQNPDPRPKAAPQKPQNQPKAPTIDQWNAMVDAAKVPENKAKVKAALTKYVLTKEQSEIINNLLNN